MDSSINCGKLQSGCSTGPLNGTCTSCLPGYYQVSSGDCLWVPTNCSNVDNSGVCTQCNDGYSLDGISKQCTQNAAQSTQVPDTNLDCRTQD